MLTWLTSIGRTNEWKSENLDRLNYLYNYRNELEIQPRLISLHLGGKMGCGFLIWTAASWSTFNSITYWTAVKACNQTCCQLTVPVARAGHHRLFYRTLGSNFKGTIKRGRHVGGHTTSPYVVRQLVCFICGHNPCPGAGSKLKGKSGCRVVKFQTKYFLQMNEKGFGVRL